MTCSCKYISYSCTALSREKTLGFTPVKVGILLLYFYPLIFVSASALAACDAISLWAWWKAFLFFVLVGITAKGCFAFSSHALNSTTSMDIFSAALASNGFTIAVTPFDSSNCFKLDFVLPEPGEHQLEMGIAEVMNGSVTFIDNASTPVTVEVLQREGEWAFEWQHPHSVDLRLIRLYTPQHVTLEVMYVLDDPWNKT